MPAVNLSQIGQIAVNVKDIARATTFYRDVLGLPFLFEVPNLAFFQCGEVRLMLAVAEKPEFDHPASIIYYRTDDIEAAADALADAGVQFEHPPALVHRAEDHELWLTSFRDPEDNILALMSEVPTAGAD